LNWTVYLFIFLTFSVAVQEWISRSIDRNWRALCMAPSFFWPYAFGLFPLGMYERPGLQPESEYSGWTQGTDQCSNSKRYKWHVTARLTRVGL
jgi:hypothetical protein